MEASFIACKHLALCLDGDASNVCRTMPCRLFSEKLRVLIPSCVLGGVWGGCYLEKFTKGQYLDMLPWF